MSIARVHVLNQLKRYSQIIIDFVCQYNINFINFQKCWEAVKEYISPCFIGAGNMLRYIFAEIASPNSKFQDPQGDI